MLDLNKVYNGDATEVLEELPENSIDLTLTSPPYDNLRDYDGYEFNFDGIAEELYRVTKQGGVVVWVVGDATVNGSETGTSFKQALYFKELGFNLRDTMIWEKTGQGAVGSNYCYWQNFEYMFVFSKGEIKTFNPICDRKNKEVGKRTTVGGRNKEGFYTQKREIEVKPYGRRFNLWKISPESNSKHKAIFPEQLAQDHIISWSNEGNIVLDTMCGSGTTCKMAAKLKRNFIGIEISKKYCEIAEKRIEPILNQRS